MTRLARRDTLAACLLKLGSIPEEILRSYIERRRRSLSERPIDDFVARFVAIQAASATAWAIDCENILQTFERMRYTALGGRVVVVENDAGGG